MIRLTPRITDETPTPLLEAGLPEVLARVLWARGVTTADDAEAFLYPSPDQLHNPYLLRQMDVAVDRVLEAIDRKERIVVYGDYDVDGVCAAALLVEALKTHGARCDWYIPSRHREGYGLNADAVRRLARQASLLITVDCGITSLEEARLCRELSLDLIITDHHEPPAQLPEAIAILNPLLGDYPFRRLCGAGVALKLAHALFGLPDIEPLLELAALATVADLVPLLGENRAIVYLGLQRMQSTRRAGLKALAQVAGLSGKVITAGHLGFQLGPRINAGGRLDDAGRAVTMLMTDDPVEAETIAAALNEENALRQRMEQEILVQADSWVLENVDFLQDRAVIVLGQGWNTGVVGLVASRMVEKYGWPTLVLSETDGVITGSARSIPGVNIHRALTMCQDLFTRFGGHAQAAGVTMPAENLPALRERLRAAITEIAEPDAFVPAAQYDLDLPLSEVSLTLVEQLAFLAPTGFGNPAPVFRLSGARVLEARGVGQMGKHLKLRLLQGSVAVDGIAFGQGSRLDDMADTIDALFSPTMSEFLGKKSAQCEISRILPHAPADAFEKACDSNADDFDRYLLTAPKWESPPPENALKAMIRDALTASCQGTLLTVSTREGALHWVNLLREMGLSARVDYCFGKPRDLRHFNTLCAMPDQDAAEGYPRHFALDEALTVGALSRILPSDDDMRGLYRTIRDGRGRFQSESALAEAAGMAKAAVRLSLLAFQELRLIHYQPIPFEASVLPAGKCSLSDSAILQNARMRGQEEQT